MIFKATNSSKCWKARYKLGSLLHLGNIWFLSIYREDFDRRQWVEASVIDHLKIMLYTYTLGGTHGLPHLFFVGVVGCACKYFVMNEGLPIFPFWLSSVCLMYVLWMKKVPWDLQISFSGHQVTNFYLTDYSKWSFKHGVDGRTYFLIS